SRGLHTMCGCDWSSDVCSSDLGQVSTVAANNGNTFANANAVSLTLNNVGVFVGAGGTLSNNTSTASVVNGNLGFGGTVTTLKVEIGRASCRERAKITDDERDLK